MPAAADVRHNPSGTAEATSGLQFHQEAGDGSAAAGAVTDVWFSSPRPKKSATTPKPSAELRSCVKNLYCDKHVEKDTKKRRHM